MNESHISSQKLDLNSCPIHSMEGLFDKTSKHKTPININDLNTISNDFEKWVNINIPKLQNAIYNILEKENIKYTKRLLKYWPIKNKNSLYKNIYSKLYLDTTKTKYDFIEWLIGNIDTGNLSNLETDKLFAKIIDNIKQIIPQFKQITISEASTLIMKCRIDVTKLSFSVYIKQ